MTAASPYRLGIDFGSSSTVAMMQWPDGRIRPLLFDGSPLLSSAVLCGPDGQLHTGHDAAHLARHDPERMEPNPKRRIDEGSVLLGSGVVEVPDLIAAVLRRVAAEAAQVAGQPSEVVLTHPVEWGPVRTGLLLEAARRAGLRQPRLAPEPVGAATYFAQSHQGDLPPDAYVLVYDLGAGTCDVTLLHHRSGQFTVTGSAGMDDIGGLDIDAALVDFLQATYGQLWHDAVGRRRLWDEVRTAKEMLSRSSSTIVTVPALGGIQVPLGRAQFDELIRPVLAPTITMVEALLDRVGVPVGRISGLFLVGGSSRIPLVGTMLHSKLGITPIITEQPELVVAEGALYPQPTAALPHTGRTPDAGAQAGAALPPDGRTPAALAAPLGRPAGRPRRILAVWGAALAAVVFVFVLVAATIYAIRDQSARHPDANGRTPDASASASSSAGASPKVSVAPTVNRYKFAKVGPLCEKIDITQLKAIFETQSTEPDSTRTDGDTFGTAHCVIGLTHTDDTGLDDSFITLSFSLWIYADANSAVQAQQRSRKNAEANKASPADEPGLGEQAFTYRKSGATAGPGKSVEYTLEVRDANLRWTAGIHGTRIADDNWSQAQRTAIETAFRTAARTSYANATATAT